ncbi:MAG: D-aminoacylase [Actinobacteria bacterium]|nr:D-aminoacylase [Actinomycetota bacterium]MCA1737421.1 D-aminoacylase [Actinomycetota bacterium]
MLDLILKNGRIVDGTGNPWFFGDVGIKDDVVVEVGRVNQSSRDTVDLRGQVISPGFIDGHCHSDLMVLDDPLSEIKLQQGVTTEVLGNCGMTPAPFTERNLNLLRSYVEPVLGRTERKWSWETVESYVDSLLEVKPSGNVATYVGHGSLRIAVMGFENRPASADELNRMKRLLEEGLQAGAIGLSLGLMYAPASYTSREELAELCSVLPRYDGLLATHIRGEGNSLIPSIEEVIWIAETCGVSLQVSHLKAAGRSNWGNVTTAMELIEDARSRGLDVTCDVYPYTAGSTTLTSLLPPWVMEGGASRALERLKDPSSRKRIKEELGHEHDGWDNLLASTGWESVYISSLSKGNGANLEGKHIAEISESRGVEPADCMMDMLLEQDGKVSIVFFHMAGADVDQVVRWERSLIASDSLHDQAEKPHPRLYGTFPHVLAKYVREDRVLTLEEAIRKMTSFPARRFRLGMRGLVAPGYAADLVVFDPETISDRATYNDPKRFPEGISCVLVNGEIVVESGVHRGVRAGRAIERS